MRAMCAVVFGLFLWSTSVVAQTITVATVTREPFSMERDGVQTGFSVELMTEAASRIGRDVEWLRVSEFGDMLLAVQDGRADAAIANISITSERETLMDFGQPMFESGIQVLLKPESSNLSSTLRALFTPQIGLLVLSSLALLFGTGMLMWLFERRRQPYFDREAGDAAFPAFWWALNLVVNGGFEERMPQSRPGRFFAVLLVIGSLFFVSIFVANITAALTVNAISEKFEGLSDLEQRRVGTIAGSTSEAFLDQRDIRNIGFVGTEPMFAAFELDVIDAIVFDGPILAYYAANQNPNGSRLVDSVYRSENYGIAFQSGSMLREDLDQALLSMIEDGTSDTLKVKWFGSAYGR